MSNADVQTAPDREQISEGVRGNIASLFNVPISTITDQTVVDDIDGWDSTSHVGLILQIEDALGVEFDIERISAFENVGELIDECLELVRRRVGA